MTMPRGTQSPYENALSNFWNVAEVARDKNDKDALYKLLKTDFVELIHAGWKDQLLRDSLVSHLRHGKKVSKELLPEKVDEEVRSSISTTDKESPRSSTIRRRRGGGL